MEISEKILNRLSTKTPFDRFRKALEHNKKLPSKDWKDLCQTIKKRDLYDILRTDLTTKEARILGNAMIKTSFRHVDDVIELIINKNDQNTPVLLASVLYKKCKIDLPIVKKYILECLKGDIRLVHLNLLYTACKNYPDIICEDVIEFSTKNGHDICKDVLDMAQARLEKE